MSLPVISVVVPCYNSENFITASIESIQNQSVSNWELILVDDGSLDQTWQIISEFCLNDTRIKSYHKENGGTSHSRNFGFSKTAPSSKYIFFLDHDDQLETSALEILSTYLDNHPDVGLLGCQYYDIDKNGVRLNTGRRSRWVPGFIIPRELSDKEIETPFVTFFCATGQGPFALFRKSVFMETDGWETKFWPHEDTDIFCQMALLSLVHFLPNQLYLKRTHPNQGMNNWLRVQDAYSAFRNKWDNTKSTKPGQAVLLNKAKRYYYSIHKPFRELKGAKVTLIKIIRKPNWHDLKWLSMLIKSAMAGFILSPFKSYQSYRS
jgi:glycosyltransferase involved in cell wall biosynthesis